MNMFIMVNQIVSVTIFCFICATHSPCASHVVVGELDVHHKHHYDLKDSNITNSNGYSETDSRDKFQNNIQIGANMEGSDSPSSNSYGTKHVYNSKNIETEFIKKIFFKYGDGNIMTVDGFHNLLIQLNLLPHLSKELHSHEQQIVKRHEHTNVDESNKTCFYDSSINFLEQKTTINQTKFSELCPVLLYGLLDDNCSEHKKNDVFDIVNPTSYNGMSSAKLLYSILAVAVISVCGVGALIIIPVMKKKFYKPLIQFLLALAVATLAGDAIIHLLPHAMSSNQHHHGHNHDDTNHNDSHLENTFKGLATMFGLIFFFIIERFVSLINTSIKSTQKDKSGAHAHVKIYNDNDERRNSTQCIEKYNTSPYCYKDIMNDPHGIEPDNSAMELLGSKSDHKIKNSKVNNFEKLETNQNLPESDLVSTTQCIEAMMLPRDHEDYTVIVREHGNEHHGHSHKHGHVHSAPKTYSSVAWMVIMGDGLHNFTDGMAIGAAFSDGLAGGFSTTVAVFCHELPHELGDFAMLLKAGMSIKQALLYNLLSSLLCIFGNLVGLYIGNTETANGWLFALVAGTFIYISLVDMIPELTSAHDGGDWFQSFLHLLGLITGVGIMALIAFYEHDLKNLFHDSE